VAAVLNQGKGDPYTAIPRMAAMAAIVAVLLSQIGGKGPSVGGGGGGGAVENDGTGTVLGDSKAKSTAVKQTIEVLQDSDPVLMRNSTNMLKHLRSIDDNILAFGASLARSVGAGDVAERMGVQQGLRAGNTGTTLAFGLPLNKLPIVGGLFESLAKGLGFGKKTSVRGQGLELGSQTLGEAAMGGVDAGFYADVNTKVKALGITLDSYTKRQRLAFGEQDRDLQVALDRTFEGVFSSALAASETFGISQADMRARLTEYELKAQAIPLKGTIEEQQQQLLASIGKITDQVFLDLLPQATKFQKTGETYVTTVGRVVYGTEQASVLLDNLGIDAIKFTEIANKQGDVGAEIVRQSIVAQESGNNFIREVIDSMTGTAEDIAELYTALDTMRDRVVDFGGSAQFISEATARAAGGADQLGEAITSFYDKFTSAGQKAAVDNQKVTELFDSLNLTLPKTRAEVLGLVNSLTRTDPAAAAKIMTATDALDSFYSKLDDLQKTTRDLEIELLKTQGRTTEATAALDALATEGMNAAELAAYNYNKSLQQQIDAIQKANEITAQRSSLEQKMFQLTGNTIALRARELDKLDASNRGLQLQIFAYEDYTKALSDATNAIAKATQDIAAAENAVKGVQDKATDNYVAATQKVADAQNSIANLAIEAARKMRDFGKSLREFVSQQVLGDTNTSAGFSNAIKNALTGDTTALESIPQLAQQAIEAAKASSKSSTDFNSARATILAQVSKVAEFAEQQASLTNIPIDDDPLVAANKSLELALQEQTAALNVANQLGASLVKAPEDLVAQYRQANADLAQAVADKLAAEDTQRRMQAALDAIASNTGKLILSITGLDEKSAGLVSTSFDGFNLLDKNLDGKLTFEELTQGLRGKATDAEIKSLISSVDLNGDNLVSAYELELVNSTKSVVDTLSKGFNALDINLDGKLSSSEFIAGMSGKASDSVLNTIFGLIDTDNDNLLTQAETTAAKTKLTADTQLEKLGESTDQIPDAVGEGSRATNQTIQDAISALSTGVMSSIMSNTANSLPLLSANLDNQGSMITLLTAVVNNTKTIADGVTAGSGTSASGSSNIFSKIGSAVGGVVSGVVSTVKKVWKKIFSDVRMKENVSLYKTLDNGINIYDFNYKAPYSFALGADRKRGVLAQEVESRYPSAVLTSANGMKQVDYSKLPIPSNMLKFATGGVFSNQVVTRPTNFQLAQMGEAGPEAVMPLARTRDGSLGVVAQPSGDSGFTAQLLVQNRALVDEMRALRDEVNLLRYEARATASATTKTTRLLERVTQNGDSLLVTDAATV
jgi:Ca2+-binding EF-hand superfamily protein